MHQPKAIWVIGLTAFWKRMYMYVCACLSSVTNQCTYTVGRKIIHASHSACRKIYSRKSSREINPRFLFRPMQLWSEIFLRNRSYFYSLWCFIAITFCFLRIFSFFSTMQFKLNLHEARDYFWKRLCIYVPHVSRLCATISCTFQSSKRVFQRNWIFATRSKARITVDEPLHDGCGFIETLSRIAPLF